MDITLESINRPDEEGDYLIHNIAGLGKCYVSGTNGDLRKLLKVVPSYDVNIQNRNGLTALHLAARCGKPYMVQLLIESGADVNLMDKNGRTPIFEAIKGSNKSISILCKSKAKLNIIDSLGFTPLSLACHIGKVEAIKQLCKKRLSLKLENSRKNGLIIDVLKSGSAVSHSNLSAMMRPLIKKGIEINKIDIETGANEANLMARLIKQDPIFADKYIVLLNFLVKEGCNPWHRDNNEMSAFDYLSEEQISWMEKSLKKYLKGKEQDYLFKLRSKNDFTAFYFNQEKYIKSDMMKALKSDEVLLSYINALI